jgi:CheY-like chemotaxis protein
MASEMDRSKVVVVLEDDDEVRRLLAEILQEKGYYVVAVDRGLRALEVLQQVRARLLVLDVMLPDMPGNRVLDLMRVDERTKDIPVMVLAGHLDTLDGSGAPDERGQVLLSKPFAVDQVIAGVEKLIGKPFVDDLLFSQSSLLSPSVAFGKGTA